METPKLYRVGARVVSTNDKEGVIIAYTLRPERFKHRHMYKVKFNGLFGDVDVWVLEQYISEIQTSDIK